MAWAPIPQRWVHSAELSRLRRATRLPVATLIGHVTLLWLWALDNAPDGKIPREPFVLADAMAYDGDADEWLDALIASGFVISTRVADTDEWEIAEFAFQMAAFTEKHLERREKGNARVRRYRDRIREQGETVTGYTRHREEVYERDNFRCVYCGSDENLCLDHLVPIIRGGDHEPSNLVTACKRHNSGKSGRLPTEVGYRFVAPHVGALYAASLARAGLTDEATQAVTVTGVTGNKTVTPRHALDKITGDQTIREKTTEIARAQRDDEGETSARASTSVAKVRWVSDDAKFAAFAHYQPDDADRKWAAKTTPTVDIESELENHGEWCYLNREKLVRDYDSPRHFWRRWMRKAVEKQNQQRGTNGQRTYAAQRLQAGAVGQVPTEEYDSRSRARARRAANE